MKSWSALQEPTSIMCEFPKNRFFFLPHFSADICRCPFCCLWRVSPVVLQVPAHRGGVRLHGCRAKAGRHRWKTNPPPSFLTLAFSMTGNLSFFLRLQLGDIIYLCSNARKHQRGSTSATLFLPQTSWSRPSPDPFSFLAKLVLTHEEMPAITDH